MELPSTSIVFRGGAFTIRQVHLPTYAKLLSFINLQRDDLCCKDTYTAVISILMLTETRSEVT